MLEKLWVADIVGVGGVAAPAHPELFGMSVVAAPRNGKDTVIVEDVLDREFGMADLVRCDHMGIRVEVRLSGRKTKGKCRGREREK